MLDKEYLDSSEFIEDGAESTSAKTVQLASVKKLQSVIGALKIQGKDTSKLEKELRLMLSANEVFD